MNVHKQIKRSTLLVGLRVTIINLLLVVAFRAVTERAVTQDLRTQGTEAKGAYSLLWGKTGEQWRPTSRLPDFSFAGYHSGEAPLPNPPVKVNLRDFGAKGDGQADDTAAFVRALEAVENGAILIPAGRYKITDIL